LFTGFYLRLPRNVEVKKKVIMEEKPQREFGRESTFVLAARELEP